MSVRYKILLVEDLPSDAELALYETGKVLKAFDYKVVDNREAFLLEFESFQPDIIISDYQLPSFDGMTALKLSIERDPLIPVIILTGSMNEDTAVECMKAGATDYVIKGHIKRLGQAILHALDEKEVRTRKKLTEEALIKSEEKFRNLFENHAAVNLIIDVDALRIVDANHAAANFYGWTIEELKQLKVYDLNTSPANVIQAALDTVIGSNKGHFEFRHKLKNGEIRDVEIYSSQITISGKNCVHSVIHDITNRKKSEAHIRLLSKAIEQSPVIILITDAEGKIQYVNSSFTRITGYSYEDAIGKKPGFLKSGYHTVEFYKALWDTILAGNEWSGEIQNKKKNGELYWENVSISPLVDEHGTLTHFVGIKEDISEKRKMLEDLLIAKDKAEAGDRLKTAFINNISHEVRTPLNGIIGFSEMLLNPDVTSENKTLFGDIIKKSSRRLLNTITSYMDISMIVSDTMEIHKKVFHLNQVLDDLNKEFSVLCQDKGLRLSLNRPAIPANIQLETDLDLLSKTLSHLLDNAIKFTLEGDIEFGFRKSDKHLDFFVNDTGIGIENEKVNLIVENFVQADISLTRGYEGSGLGLSIAQGITKILGGNLIIHSEKGKGTSITVSLPDKLMIMQKSVPHEPRIIPMVQKDPLILVAEDDEFNYKFLEIVLKKAGYPVVRAENGLEAVEICRNNSNVTMVLMDIKMPIMGGIEATREIKSFLPDLPVIALTAYVSNQDEYEALISGCDDYIPKPVNRVKLLELIRKIIGGE